jgi:magnesium-transporting ATPase (P-type)
MRHLGFAFRDRDDEDNIIIDKPMTGEVLKYKLMHVFEFNSDRKRMSVIVRTPDNRIMIVCKGADSIINARLEPG